MTTTSHSSVRFAIALLTTEERHQAMATLVAEQGRVSVAQLAATYDVTTETIRRDLTALEDRGLVRRVHGGAIAARSLALLEALHLLPPPGGTLLLGAGSTTARLVEHLPLDRALTVYTHAVPLAARLAGLESIDLHLLPGRVRETTQAAVGAQTVAAIDTLRVDVVFLGSNGLSVDHGLSTPDADEAATKAAMSRRARQVVALVDSSKVGRDDAVRFASLDDIDVLVTDDAIDADVRSAFEDAGVEVVLATHR